jgi:hypothetical protein
MEDFLGDDPGFAGSGTGEDKLHAGVGNGFMLGWGEGHGYGRCWRGRGKR